MSRLRRFRRCSGFSVSICKNVRKISKKVVGVTIYDFGFTIGSRG